MRPCTCDRCGIGKDFVKGVDCKSCWLWHNRPDNPIVRIWKGEMNHPRQSKVKPIGIRGAKKGCCGKKEMTLGELLEKRNGAGVDVL